jgi:hypothetical protein
MTIAMKNQTFLVVQEGMTELKYDHLFSFFYFKQNNHKPCCENPSCSLNFRNKESREELRFFTTLGANSHKEFGSFATFSATSWHQEMAPMAVNNPNSSFSKCFCFILLISYYIFAMVCYSSCM